MRKEKLLKKTETYYDVIKKRTRKTYWNVFTWTECSNCHQLIKNERMWTSYHGVWLNDIMPGSGTSWFKHFLCFSCASTIEKAVRWFYATFE